MRTADSRQSAAPCRRRRVAAVTGGAVSAGGLGALVALGVVSWGVLAAWPLCICAVIVLAAVVFAICALTGIDPGPGGERLADLVRDVLRR